MSSLVIAMPPALQQWVDSRLSEGRYADAADYVRDLLRRDQEWAAGDRLWLKAMIDEGRASGLLDDDPETILDEVIAEDPDLRG